MVDCPNLELATSFSQPRQHFSADTITSGDLSSAFSSAAGGLLIPTTQSGIKFNSRLLDAELNTRLSLPWLTATPPHPQRLAMLCGGRNDFENGTGKRIYSAAKALGISMVVLDAPGHWIELPEYSHLREVFLPIELSRGPEFPQRIVDMLEAYGKKIDGIITFFESYLVAVATAAEIMGLPTQPPEAYAIATDKYKTSVHEGHKTFLAHNLEEAVSISQDAGLPYPLIVKPCRGWSSEGVTLVSKPEDLSSAVAAIDTSRHGTAFVMEEYCSGPEVDANLVLLDDELLFFEVSDDLPKSAEAAGESGEAGKAGNFVETTNILPSALPSAELALLRDELHQSLRRMGLTSGMYHLEARVKDSSMEYTLTKGIIDLSPVPSQQHQKPPSSWLIEINPRPPGVQTSDASQSTYGIDFWGLGLLFPLDDKERLKSLSTPFSTETGAQYWSKIIFIPVEKEGVLWYDDVDVNPCQELLNRIPELRQCVSTAVCLWKKGDRLPDPSIGTTVWMGYFVVFSRLGRRHVQEIANLLMEEIRFEIRTE